MVKRAILGPTGTYSEEAAQIYWGEGGEYIFASTIGDVFAMVSSGAVEEGLVPISNSRSGSIRTTMCSLIDHNLYIAGEVILTISHCLMAREPMGLEEIELIISQPEALWQCEKRLAEMVPGARQEIVRSTAQAAVSARDDVRRAAALGSKRAAEMYGMIVIADKMEDEDGNCTTFVHLKREHSAAGRKTSIIFELKDRPGALYHALEPLARKTINLSKLESRPRGSENQSYVFFAEIEGGMNHPEVRAALEELAERTAFLKSLGSY